MNSRIYFENAILTLITSFVVMIVFPAGCSGMNKQLAMANPASVNCIKKGGTLSIEKRGDGGECGVCIFEGNRQCEEWAMLRGECPEGGVKVTGYITPAARICVITGGTYENTGNVNMDEEQGTCTFKNGTVCNVRDYYNGKCGKTDKVLK